MEGANKPNETTLITGRYKISGTGAITTSRASSLIGFQVDSAFRRYLIFPESRIKIESRGPSRARAC